MCIYIYGTTSLTIIQNSVNIMQNSIKKKKVIDFVSKICEFFKYFKYLFKF